MVGGTVGGGTTTVAGTAGAGGAQAPTCTNPRDVGGLRSCDEGYTHRPRPVACEVLHSSGAGGASDGAGGETQLPRATSGVPCSLDDAAACSQFELGFCGSDDYGFGGQSAFCESGCVTDDDCGDNAFCSCDGPSPTGGVCVRGMCQSDADCLQGYHCAEYSTGCGGGWACQTPRDTCTSDADCDDGACYPSGPDEDGPRACQPQWVCGRPFLVRAEARVAELEVSDAWLGDLVVAPDVARLAAAERERNAALWSRLALLEHASIAAFARFSLQLLGLGAPPQLIEECTAALVDETAHARLCFAMASAYAGRALGPGKLDVANSLDCGSLEEIVDLVIVEGCFGETGAALEALAAADTAQDPAVRDAFSRIAKDEQRHAELAFRFLRWAVEQSPSVAGARVALACGAPELQRHPAHAVALPCLRALLGSISADQAPRPHDRVGSAPSLSVAP
jgi:hypothetical protein